MVKSFYTIEEQKKRILKLFKENEFQTEIQIHLRVWSYKNRNTTREAIKELLEEGKIKRVSGGYEIEPAEV